MKTILKSSIFKNNLSIRTFKNDFKCSNYTEKKIKIKSKDEEGSITEIEFDGIRIIMRDLKTIHHSIRVTHDFPFFKLQFEIEGSSCYKPLNKLSTAVYIPNQHYNLFYLPEVNGILNYNTNYRKTLEILFTENYIKKIIGQEYKNVLNKFGIAVANRTPFLMWKRSKPISTELKTHIDKIINCKYPEDLKKGYLEAKISELLIFLLAKTNEINYEEENVNLSTVDHKKILEVSAYIKKNLKNSLTITELASYIGINSSKLKHDFKVQYSTTIFKYITKMRMEKAKELILEKNYNITEASYKVGYKHSQHFTVAFKKMYGYLPSELLTSL